MAFSSDEACQGYQLMAKGARGRALMQLISDATSDERVFAFGELLEVPSIAEMPQSPELAPHYALLELFAYGTWTSYKEAAQASSLPPISAKQINKLKQMTVVALAIEAKNISYQSLMEQLDIPTVRELEDFIITECFYTNLVMGKLDQKQRCLKVHDVIGRDVRQSELEALDEGLGAWLAQCTNVMASIEDRIQFAVNAAEAAKKHAADVEAKTEEMKRSLKTEIDLRSADFAMADDGDYIDEERLERPIIERAERPIMERAERSTGRTKRRIVR